MDITLLGSGENEGEYLLLQLLDAVKASPRAKPEHVAKFEKAILAMLKENDSESRWTAFAHTIGMVRPGGRPRADWRAIKQQREQASDYWLARLIDGMKKGEALEQVAQECQRSGDYPEGQPSTATVRRNRDKHPAEAKYALYYLEAIKPGEERLKAATAEVRYFLAKTS